MDNETLAQFLDRRERELTAQVSALRGQLEPRESELAEIQKMKLLMAGGKAMGVVLEAAPLTSGPPQLGTPSMGVAPAESVEQEGVANRSHMPRAISEITRRYEAMT